MWFAYNLKRELYIPENTFIRSVEYHSEPNFRHNDIEYLRLYTALLWVASHDKLHLNDVKISVTLLFKIHHFLLTVMRFQNNCWYIKSALLNTRLAINTYYQSDFYGNSDMLTKQWRRRKNRNSMVKWTGTGKMKQRWFFLKTHKSGF